MSFIIIDEKTNIIRSKEIGIYDYIVDVHDLDDYNDNPIEGHKLIWVDEFDLNGMYLPKWNAENGTWTETATEEDIIRIEMALTDGTYLGNKNAKIPIPIEMIQSDQIVDIQIVVAFLYEEVLRLGGNVEKIHLFNQESLSGDKLTDYKQNMEVTELR